MPLLRVLYEEARYQTGMEGGILTLWRAREREAYGGLWHSPSAEAKGELLPMQEWEKRTASLAVGNVRVGEKWLYVPEVTWMSVGRASLSVEGLSDPMAIGALVPVYFRSFIPTQRRHEPFGSALRGG